MTDRIVLVHTVKPLIEVFDRLGEELIPGAEILHVLDEPLLAQVRQHGKLTQEDIGGLQSHVRVAERIAAHGVLVTCSTLSPAVDFIRASIPVLKIDEAMLKQAVAFGRRIVVVATAQSTLEPTKTRLTAEASRIGNGIELQMVLVDQAFEALMHGDAAAHDRLVKEAILQWMSQVDVIVLAQASMARVCDVIPESERRVPILTSPHTAMQEIRRRLEQRHSDVRRPL